MPNLRRHPAILAIGAVLLATLGQAAPGDPPRQATQPAAPDPSRSGAPVEPRDFAEADALIAYHRLIGGEPDFRALAEAILLDRGPSSPYSSGTGGAEGRFALDRARRRLRSEFEAFDLDRPYTLQFAARILDYDRGRGGIPLNVGAFRSAFAKDPTGQSGGFLIRFRNAEAIGVVPAADVGEARALLRTAGLDPDSGRPSYGLVEVTFALAGVLPKAVEVRENSLAAEVLAARVVSATGQLLHDFHRVSSVAAATARRRAGPPVLKAAEVHGLRIGMTLDEAQAAALRGHGTQHGSAFYAGLPGGTQGGSGFPECSSGVAATVRSSGVPLSPEPSYAACVAFWTVGPGDRMAGRLTAATGVRFLPGADPEEVRRGLERSFGPPIEEIGGRLIWIGLDPAAGARDGMVEIRAEFARVAQGGPKRTPGVVLAVSLERHMPAPTSP